MSKDLNKDSAQEMAASRQLNSQVGNVNSELDGSEEISRSGDKFRAVFSAANQKKYKSDTNPTGWKPYANEIFVDENGCFYVWVQDQDGQLVQKSLTKDLFEVFKKLNDLGVIQNAEAFRLNGKIYNFLFNNEKKVLRLNTELDIYNEYKYYSVRSLERNPDTGDYVYISGIQESVSAEDSEALTVISHLANIIEIDGRAIPSSCSMINDCVDGGRYIVDYYDSARHPVASQVFFAREVHALDFSLAPEQAIRELTVTTDRPHMDGCFLYQNEDITNMIIRCGVRYADGSTRDVTEERVTTGRLIWKGYDEIDSTQLTPGDGEPQKIEIYYYTSADNGNQPISHDSLSLEDLTKNPNTLVLKKDLKVYITEDIYDPIIDITFHGYKKVVSSGGVANIFQTRVFAHYASGNMRDITPIMDNTRLITTAGFVYNQETKCLESSKILSNFAVEMKIPQGRGEDKFEKSFNCEFTEYNKRMNINASSGGFDTKDPAKFTVFNATQGKLRLLETDTLATIKQNYVYKYNLTEENYITPTHVIVRSAMNPDIIYSGTSIADAYTELSNPNGVIDYTVPDANLILEDMALLVEFYKIDTDSDTGARTNIHLCKIQRTYAKSTSTTLG